MQLLASLARSAARRSRCTAVQSRCSPRVALWSSKTPDEDRFKEWIPPDRPLSGDKGQSNLFTRDSRKGPQAMVADDERNQEHVDDEGGTDDDEEQDDDEQDEILQLEKALEAEQERRTRGPITKVEEPVDWLQTRRAKQFEGVGIMTPAKGSSKKRDDSDLPIVRHTLFTSDEITTCVVALGGHSVTVIRDTHGRMGGANGMILVTASSAAQIRLLADTLIRQLKRRQLDQMNVSGATLGSEGTDDKNETWRVLDCGNYLVHILDGATRKHLNLERLWSGQDPSRNVSSLDEAAMDDYVAANPVPEGYGLRRSDEWASSVSQMTRNAWIVPHRPVIAKAGKKKRRTSPKRVPR